MAATRVQTDWSMEPTSLASCVCISFSTASRLSIANIESRHLVEELVCNGKIIMQLCYHSLLELVHTNLPAELN